MSRRTGERQSRIRLIRPCLLAPSAGVAMHTKPPRGQRHRVLRPVARHTLDPGRPPAGPAVLRPAVTRTAEPEAHPAPPAFDLEALHVPGAGGSALWTSATEPGTLTKSTVRALRPARSIEGAESLPPVPHLRACPDRRGPPRPVAPFRQTGSRALVISVAMGPYEPGGITLGRERCAPGARRLARERRAGLRVRA